MRDRESWARLFSVTFMVKLTQEIVLQRTKTNSPQEVQQLTISNALLDDISFVARLTEVEKISLSLNQISTLEPFQYCKKLCELYLRRNNISSLNELSYLSQLPHLRILWLSDNPIAESPNYRKSVIQACPQLEVLDNTTVTAEERQSLRQPPPSAPSSAEQRPSTHQARSSEPKPSASAEASAKSARPVSRKKIVYGILHLLDELDEENLRIVIAESRARLKLLQQEGDQA